MSFRALNNSLVMCTSSAGLPLPAGEARLSRASNEFRSARPRSPLAGMEFHTYSVHASDYCDLFCSCFLIK